MTLKELWMIIIRGWKLIAAAVLVCVLACGAYLLIPKATSDSHKAVAYIVGNSQAAGVAGLASTEARQMAEELDEANIKVTAKGDTATLTVSVTAEGLSYDDCAAVANKIAEKAKAAAEEAYSNWENPYQGSVELASAEELDEDKSSGLKSKLKYLVVALLAGLFAAICIIVLLDMRKRPVKTPEGLQESAELSVLEILPAQSGERLLANVRFAANRPQVSSVVVVPTGDASAAQAACELLKETSVAEGAGGAIEVSVASPLSETMAGAYASRDADVVIVTAKQWVDTLPQFESTIAELRLAGANLAGVVFAKDK